MSLTADRMSTKTQGSEKWETCKTLHTPTSAQSSALASPESFTVGADTGTIPTLPLNEEQSERIADIENQDTGDKGLNGAPVTPYLSSHVQGVPTASQPLPIASPWSIPVRPDSPGVAPNLLRRASRANATTATNVTPSSLGPDPHAFNDAASQSFAALVLGHHAAPAPPPTQPAKILDCNAAHQLQPSPWAQSTSAMVPPGAGGRDGATSAVIAATPDLRTAVSGGLLRRRSGSNSRRVKPARARNNTKVLLPLHVASLLCLPPAALHRAPIS